VREIRMLRVKWRELETGSRTSLAGHEGGNPGYRQGMIYRVTAPALDPTNCSFRLVSGRVGKEINAFGILRGGEREHAVREFR